MLRALVLTLCCALPAAALQDAQRWSGWDDVPPAAEIEAERGRVRALLDGLPADAEEGSSEARSRAAAERRLTLLDELAGAADSLAELRESLAEAPDRVPALEARLEELRAAPAPAPPQEATTEGFEELQGRADELGERVAELKAELEAAAGRADRQADLSAAAEERARAAGERAQELEASLATSTDAERGPARLLAANARLDALVATQVEELLAAQLRADTELVDYRSLALSVAEAELARCEAELALYAEALEQQLERRQREREAELAEKEDRAESATDPWERFVARWEADVARSKKSLADVEPLEVDVAREVADQGERLEFDQGELERLRKDVEESGTGGAVGRSLQRLFPQLPQRREAVRIAVKPHFEDERDALSDRRFEIDEELYGLARRWEEELDAAVGEAGASARRPRARELLEELRTALQTERGALTKALGGIRELERIQSERARVLARLEAFLQAKVFWIRDRPALDERALEPAAEELERARAWALGSGARESLATLVAAVADPVRWGPALLALLALPVVALLVHRRLRRATAALGEREPTGWSAARLAAAAVLRSLLVPGCVVAVARLLPELLALGELGAVVERATSALALALLLRSVARAVFGRDGAAPRLGWVGAETAESFARALRRSSWATLVLLVPWALLTSPPLSMAIVPRVLLVVFLALVAHALFGAFRGGSPWMDELFGSAPAQAKRAWSALLLVALASLPVLEATGRRIAVQRISTSLALTLVTALLLPGVYRLLIRLVERPHAPSPRPRRGRRKDKSEREQRETVAQVSRLVRLGLGVLAVYLLSLYWGVTSQMWHSLEAWTLYASGVDPVTGERLYVTAANLVTAAAVLGATVWLLHQLPGIYDVVVFPRLQLDRGLRYAIVTISRYCLFFLGALIAFQAVRLDLTQVGWLVAAMGVGLGFGLQEIVSNFVSGILLLVERPIRVGDLVTIGQVSGTVQRINIRATTVQNFDRQEVIVPNRSLITQDVTNWTLQNNLNRLIVPIGVAYGSDVDEVHAILTRVAEADPDVLDDPAPQILFMAHGASSLDFEVRVFLGTPDVRLGVTDRLNTAINRALAEAGIEIPFPQRDLHLRSSDVLLTPRQAEATGAGGDEAAADAIAPREAVGSAPTDDR